MIATAMIAGCIQDGRSDGILSTGRRATADTRPGEVDDADSGTGVGTKLGRSALEAGVQAGCSLARGGGVTGSKYGACGGSIDRSGVGMGTYGAGAGGGGMGSYFGGSYFGGSYFEGSHAGGSGGGGTADGTGGGGTTTGGGSTTGGEKGGLVDAAGTGAGEGAGAGVGNGEGVGGVDGWGPQGDRDAGGGAGGAS
jgi:hypothetical protein